MALVKMLRYVRPDENWSTIAAMSATSQQVGYEAANAKNLDPAWPWWSDSTTATLTATFSAHEVGIAAVIHPNFDPGKTVTFGGSLAGTVAASTGGGGYPKNVALIPNAPVMGATSVTVNVAGNTNKIAIGELVVGKLREFPFALMPGATRTRKRSVIDDTDDTYDHDIRIDRGAEKWRAQGRMFGDDPALEEFISLWESSRGGTRPVLIVPNNYDAEPRLCRMGVEYTHSNDGKNKHYFDVQFVECGRGIVVI